MDLACATCFQPMGEKERLAVEGCPTHRLCLECCARHPSFLSYCPYCPLVPQEGSSLDTVPSSSRHIHVVPEEVVGGASQELPPAYEDLVPGYSPSIEGATLDYTPKGKKGLLTGWGEDEPIIHYILPTDTIVGIALRYNIEVSDLRRANRLFDDSLIARRVLRIPLVNEDGNCSYSPLPPPNEDRKLLVKRFQLRTKCVNYHEACFYIIDADGNLEQAIIKYYGDMRWEAEQARANRMPPSPSSSSPASFSTRGKGKGKNRRHLL